MREIKDWKIRTRLLVAFLAGLIPFFLLAAASGLALWTIWRNTSGMYHEAVVEHQRLSDVEAAVDRLDVGATQYLAEGGLSARASFERAVGQLHERLTDLHPALSDDPDERNMILAVQTLGGQIETAAQEILSAPEGKALSTLERLRQRIHEVSTLLNRAQAIGLREMRAERERVSRAIGWTTAVGLGTLALSVAGGITLALALSGWLSRPILAIAQTSRRMAEGDLSQRVAVPAGGELGEAAQAFNEMAEHLETSTRENIKLRDSAQHRAQQLATLNELSRALTMALAPEAVARATLAAVQVLVPNAVARLWKQDEEGQALGLVGSVGLKDPAGGEMLQLQPGQGLVGIATASKEPVLCPDLAGDPRFINKEWAAKEGLTSSVVLPLMAADRVIGALMVYTRLAHEFSDEEVAILRSFADQAAIAVENARLYEAVRQDAATLEARVRQRTAELEEALRVKVEFLAKMSHELRTPLNFVLGFTDLLKGGAAGPLTAKQAHYLDRIKSGGQRLLELITDLLDLSQIEAGKATPQLRSVLLAPLVQEVLGLVHVQAAQKRLTVTTALDPRLPPVVADSGKLTSILAHLVGNAVKFTPEGGRITVTARRVAQIADCKLQIADLKDAQPISQSEISNLQSEMVEIAVTDTGIGIPSNDLERVFAPFYQVDSSEARAYGGAGLGLALVRKLVELHGGRAWAESEGPGKGARFIVRLPRLAAPRPARVLVVEDDAIYRDFLRMVLEQGAFAVEEAETGTKALTLLGTTPPDLLVLDLGLPDLDGLEILAQVRGNAHTRDLPILVLTGLGSDHAEGALARGADEFLTKPVSPQVLVEIVGRLLERSKRESARGEGSATSARDQA